MNAREREKHIRDAAQALYESAGPSDSYPWHKAGKGVRDFWIAKVRLVLKKAEQAGLIDVR